MAIVKPTLRQQRAKSFFPNHFNCSESCSAKCFVTSSALCLRIICFSVGLWVFFFGVSAPEVGAQIASQEEENPLEVKAFVPDVLSCAFLCF